jgi:hypothetical protein
MDLDLPANILLRQSLGVGSPDLGIFFDIMNTTLLVLTEWVETLAWECFYTADVPPPPFCFYD